MKSLIKRAKYDCPPGLANVIRLSNLLNRTESESPFPDFLTVWNQIVGKNLEDKYALTIQGLNSLPDQAKEAIQEVIINYCQYLDEPKIKLPLNDFYEIEKKEWIVLAFVEWMELEKLRHFLSGLLTRIKKSGDFVILNELENGEFPTRDDIYGVFNFGIFGKAKYIYFPEINILAGSLLAVVERDGRLFIHFGYVLDSLNGIEISRLRACEVCSKFFWAKRKDSFACCKKHAKVRQMRLLRKSWDEKSDLYLKARKKKKENKTNGSL